MVSPRLERISDRLLQESIDAKALDDFTTFRIAGEALQRLAAERAS